ncbi:MAG: Lrp/AsnC family transcriptional regulator [Oscillospiraceae bacterium]|nr:Lrp/AsnC family transcriptional regulator [Oscillospiraceae bacterium]
MNLKLLKLLSDNARYTNREIAVMIDMSEQEVENEIKQMEQDGLIRGYKAVIDWERLDSAKVSAIIELRVAPQPDAGFEDIARKVMKYDEVESVYLMSGGYDLCVLVKGKTFQEVAMFVAKQLAPMKFVLSTSTHFVLRRYKELDIELYDNASDDRGRMSLC